MSDLFGNHDVGFPTRRLKLLRNSSETIIASAFNSRLFQHMGMCFQVEIFRSNDRTDNYMYSLYTVSGNVLNILERSKRCLKYNLCILLYII